MKKAILLLSFLGLFSCKVETTSPESINSTNDVESIATSEQEASSSTNNDNELESCNFTMDLDLYKNIDENYTYENEYGTGNIVTNKIFITCNFVFLENYKISDEFKLFVNEEEITKIEKVSDQEIIFKVEDTSWSNIY